MLQLNFMKIFNNFVNIRNDFWFYLELKIFFSTFWEDNLKEMFIKNIEKNFHNVILPVW